MHGILIVDYVLGILTWVCCVNFKTKSGESRKGSNLLVLRLVWLGVQSWSHGGVQPLLEHGVLRRAAQRLHHSTLLTLSNGICKNQ